MSMKKIKAMFAALKANREEKRRQRFEEILADNQKVAELQIELSGFVSL
jgi:hypothetical protein